MFLDNVKILITYYRNRRDLKASDPGETQRIISAGGRVIEGRVQGTIQHLIIQYNIIICHQILLTELMRARILIIIDEKYKI